MAKSPTHLGRFARRYCVSGNQPRIPAPRLFERSFLCGGVNVDQPEALAIPFRAFKVVEQAPGIVAANICAAVFFGVQLSELVMEISEGSEFGSRITQPCPLFLWLWQSELSSRESRTIVPSVSFRTVAPCEVPGIFARVGGAIRLEVSLDASLRTA